MTGVIKYRTNFIFNVGKETQNIKSTITTMYKEILLY